MLNCKDPALTALRSKGYNVVLVPKSDLRPTQLLVANGKKLQRLGELPTVFIPDPGQALPSVSLDNPGPAIGITKSASLNVGVGLKILSGLIGALGGSTLGVTAAYKRAKSVALEYSDVLVDNTAPAELDVYLAQADVNPFARAVAEMLEGDEVYIVTSVLKASTLTVEAKGEGGASLGLDLPVVQAAVGANISVETKGGETSKLTYKGKIPLAFGFQAIRLIFDNGQYRTMKLVDAGAVALEAVGGGGGKDPVYLAVDGLVGGF